MCHVSAAACGGEYALWLLILRVCEIDDLSPGSRLNPGAGTDASSCEALSTAGAKDNDEHSRVDEVLW